MKNKIIFAAITTITSIVFCSPAYAVNPFPGVNYGDWISGYQWTDHYDQISNSWTTMNTKSCPANSDVDFQSQTMLTTSDGAPLGHDDTFGCRNRYDPANDVTPTPSPTPTPIPSTNPVTTPSTNPSLNESPSANPIPTPTPTLTIEPTINSSGSNADISIASRGSKISFNDINRIKIFTVQKNKLYYLTCSRITNIKNTNKVIATRCTKTYVRNIKKDS